MDAMKVDYLVGKWDQWTVVEKAELTDLCSVEKRDVK
jgi:hypothetical protein